MAAEAVPSSTAPRAESRSCTHAPGPTFTFPVCLRGEGSGRFTFNKTMPPTERHLPPNLHTCTCPQRGSRPGCSACTYSHIYHDDAGSIDDGVGVGDSAGSGGSDRDGALQGHA